MNRCVITRNQQLSVRSVYGVLSVTSAAMFNSVQRAALIVRHAITLHAGVWVTCRSVQAITPVKLQIAVLRKSSMGLVRLAVQKSHQKVVGRIASSNANLSDIECFLSDKHLVSHLQGGPKTIN